MLPPPHSLHTLRCRPCSQMLPPPHSLHRLRRRPCSQMLPPPQSLHLLRPHPCLQMPPPHTLHLAPAALPPVRAREVSTRPTRNAVLLRVVPHIFGAFDGSGVYIGGCRLSAPPKRRDHALLFAAREANI